jgi:glutamate decarboxylase
MAIVGIAGTTETGSVDPLESLSDVAKEFKAHYHVDAAWGGPTLFSHRYKSLLKGIERADSVTLDAHKQLYVPMGCGLVVFKDPAKLKAIEHHANYVIRQGSRDLGSNTLEGSRPGMAMLVHSGLKIIAREGYEILIEQGINKARTFATLIKSNDDFELISDPELNIVTYRYCPSSAKRALASADEIQMDRINGVLDRITKHIQKVQREKGLSFVSRTRLEPKQYHSRSCVVFRTVLANPLTTMDILQDILVEQSQIAQTSAEIQTAIKQLDSFCNAVVA